MRLLNTRVLDLREFDHHGGGMPPYAILSHVWNKGRRAEQGFREISALIENRARGPNSEEKRDPWQGVSPKLKGFCELASKLGYEWAWADTCCIDKDSSAELSEAINSMFAWYSKAGVCIALLQDVNSTSWIQVPMGRQLPQIAESKWFTRGWTLQELVAPAAVVFVTQTWKVIGTKTSLSSVISAITGIEADVLTTPGSFLYASVLQRMMWARKRETTRVEDRAYSLMGLFGVNMPTIYGEGENAFRRLQEEILKMSADQTLFAWEGVAAGPGILQAHNWPPGLLAPSLAVFDVHNTTRGATGQLPLEEIPTAVEAFVSVLERSRRIVSLEAPFQWVSGIVFCIVGY